MQKDKIAPKKKAQSKTPADKRVETNNEHSQPNSNKTNKKVVKKNVLMDGEKALPTRINNKNYPIIYSYIYEREAIDMERIYNEHKNLQPSQAAPPKISGFKIENGNLVPIIIETKE